MTGSGYKSAWRSRLTAPDVVGVGLYGIRGRRGRAILTAIGISIGIAAIVAVFGISSSSKADLLAQIDALGTNLLVVTAGDTLGGDDSKIPVAAPDMARRISPVRSASAVAMLDTEVQRNKYDESPNGLDVYASESNLLETLEGTMTTGRFLDEETSTLPTVVLGSVAAQRLGITGLADLPTVYIGDQEFAVVGILDPLTLHPDLDRSVLIGEAATTTYLGADLYPTRVYVRTTPEHVDAVRSVLGRTVNPGAPNEVEVTRPSDALAARAQVDEGLQNLLLGLGGVALLVGGVGVANVMVISVIERRQEIGLRRAIGATRRHIGVQFLIESVTLTTLGGLIGAGLGSLITYVYAQQQGWTIVVPVTILGAAIAAALTMGAVAGLYPAVRASRMDPAEAVRPST